MNEDFYGVTFEDQGTTYLVALFDARGEAEDYAEGREEEDAERADATTYEVKEIDPEAIDVEDVRLELERGFSVRLDG